MIGTEGDDVLRGTRRSDVVVGLGHIAFPSNRSGSGEVWLMRFDGSGQRRLTSLPKTDEWSPAFARTAR